VRVRACELILQLPENDPLDEDFPLGDGTAATEAEVICPYCAETMTIALDPGSGTAQEYEEDCAVCCQPWRVTVAYGAGGEASVEVNALND
jgi:hypothetical protein